MVEAQAANVVAIEQPAPIRFLVALLHSETRLQLGDAFEDWCRANRVEFDGTICGFGKDISFALKSKSVHRKREWHRSTFIGRREPAEAALFMLSLSAPSLYQQ